MILSRWNQKKKNRFKYKKLVIDKNINKKFNNCKKIK